jgi:hypothetical protein
MDQDIKTNAETLTKLCGHLAAVGILPPLANSISDVGEDI